MDTCNWWLPTESPDGKDATMLMSTGCITAPFKLPGWIIDTVLKSLAPDMAQQFITAAHTADTDPVQEKFKILSKSFKIE